MRVYSLIVAVCEYWTCVSGDGKQYIFGGWPKRRAFAYRTVILFSVSVKVICFNNSHLANCLVFWLLRNSASFIHTYILYRSLPYLIRNFSRKVSTKLKPVGWAFVYNFKMARVRLLNQLAEHLCTTSKWRECACWTKVSFQIFERKCKNNKAVG